MKTNLERGSGLPEAFESEFVKSETTGRYLRCYVRIGKHSCGLHVTFEERTMAIQLASPVIFLLYFSAALPTNDNELGNAKLDVPKKRKWGLLLYFAAQMLQIRPYSLPL
jgi:hypothetical protein